MPIIAVSPPNGPSPRKRPILDGMAALKAFVERASYASVVAAVAEWTVFLDPETVAQTHGHALFPIMRYSAGRVERGQETRDIHGRRVILDDNKVPTDAFLAAGVTTRGRDVQLNHVWDGTTWDPDSYTALWNVCATPAFLAKTTDGNNYPEVRTALKYRSYELYGAKPAGVEVPSKPAGYDTLVWADSPPAIKDLEGVLRAWLRRCPRSIATRAAREFGWIFSDWEPDASLPGSGI
jgi:hypothetical protein